MCSFLFASPEALITSKWRETMDCHQVAERIVAVVIEAHCVQMLRITKAASADDSAEACIMHACIQLISLIIANYMIVNIIKSQAHMIISP